MDLAEIKHKGENGAAFQTADVFWLIAEVERLQSYESAVKQDATYQKAYDDGQAFQRQQSQSSLTLSREEGRRDFSPFAPPFEYHCGKILDAKGHNIADIRGWGYLTGKGGGLGMDEDKAAQIQDGIGKSIAELMNDAAIRSEAKGETQG